MKFIFIGILFIFFANTAFGQQNLSDSGFTNKTEAKNESKDSLKEGKWIEYLNENGQIINTKGKVSIHAGAYQLTTYYAGKPNGVVRVYSMDGKLISETPYANGIKSGVVKTYYYDGVTESETPYSGDKKNGIARTYYDTGTTEVMSGYKDKHIEYIKHPKIILKSEYQYTNDLANGLAKNYYDTGTLESEIPFTNGKVDGLRKRYYENGKLMETELWVKGSFHMGTRKEYDKNGNEIK